MGVEGEYRLRHMGYQPEVHHEPRGGRTPAYTTFHKMRLGYEAAKVEHELISVGPKRLMKQNQRAHTADNVLSSPSCARMSSTSVEATGRTVVMEEVNTDQIVERDGGAPCQVQSMTVSMNRGGTTTAATVPRCSTNTVESGIGCVRSVARHQGEQADEVAN